MLSGMWPAKVADNKYRVILSIRVLVEEIAGEACTEENE